MLKEELKICKVLFKLVGFKLILCSSKMTRNYNFPIRGMASAGNKRCLRER